MENYLLRFKGLLIALTLFGAPLAQSDVSPSEIKVKFSEESIETEESSTHRRPSKLAKMLGYGPNDKILLIHADDMGLTELTNKAIVDVMDFGIIKSASVMIPAPAAKSAIEKYGHYDLGLHLALTSEWQGFRWRPISKGKEVRSLTEKDSEGPFLHRDHAPLFINAKTKHVRKELEAQIKQALAWGLQPTHLDYHMAAVLLKPCWIEAYFDLAKKYQIPPMYFRWSDHISKQVPALGRFFLKRLSQEAEKAGFLLFDWGHLNLPNTLGDERKETYIKMFQNLKPGVNYIFNHPAYMPERHAFPGTMSRVRPADAALMQDRELKQLLDDMDIKLIGWREIQALYDWNEVHWPPKD